MKTKQNKFKSEIKPKGDNSLFFYDTDTEYTYEEQLMEELDRQEQEHKVDDELHKLLDKIGVNML